MKINKKSIFAQRYLRAVGQRWMCPADSLPCFFKLTRLMKAEMPETQLSSAESPMQGNNWRPTHPDGGERPIFFISFLPQNFIRITKLSLTPIWCYGIVLMCHNVWCYEQVCLAEMFKFSTNVIGKLAYSTCYVPLNFNNDV